MSRLGKKRRGIAIVTALFFGLMCMFMATGFLAQVPVDLGATTLLERHTKASYIADAAIVDTMAYMSFELANGNEPCTGPSYTNTGTLGDWTWECVVVPDAETPPNGLSNLRIYNLTATAFYDGDERYRIVADVQGGQSFARFNFFVDEDDGMVDFDVSEYTRVQGPVHKNHEIRFRIAVGFYNRLPGPPTPFNSLISSTSDHHVWSDAWPGSTTDMTPEDEEQYALVFQNGSADLEFNVLPRPMPTDSLPLAIAAFGSAPPATIPPGVVVNPGGGVFIEGTVQELGLTVVDDSFVLEVTQDHVAGVTRIREDEETNTRIITHPDGTVESVPGLGSQVVFVRGDVQSLQGQNKGQRTIANDFETPLRHLTITGPITRLDTPVPPTHYNMEVPLPDGTNDALGLITETIYLPDSTELSRSLNNPLLIYASIFATNRLEVKEINTASPGQESVGALAIVGGIQSKYTWHVRNSWHTGETTSGYGGLQGFGTPDVFYDKLLPNDPPPEYPTTAATELTIRSWTEQRL